MALSFIPSAEPAIDDVAEPPRRLRVSRETSLAWVLAAVFFTLYTLLAVRDQQRMLTTGFDLGIFDQAVQAYAHGHLPYVPLKGFDLLGDHFSPIIALWAPFYLLWSSVYTLLLGQAALFALGVVPLVRWAAKEVGMIAGAVVGFGYGASWGIASAAGFDVHEVAFGVPMLAFSAVALGRRRWRAAAAWALPLLLVKEDLGLTVGVVGVLIAVGGARRLGAATAVAGVLGTIIEVKILIPLANPGGTYGYSTTLPNLFGSGQGDLAHQILTLITPETKVTTLVLMLAPTAFLALRSPLIWLAVPTLGWRFASDNPVYWSTAYHYSAVLMPVVFAAFVHALIRWRAVDHPQAVRSIRTSLAASVAVTALLIPDFPLGALLHASTWRTSPSVAAVRRLLDRIPDGVTVAADNHLVPQISDRDTVVLFDAHTPQKRPAWVIVDTAMPDEFPLIGNQQATILTQLAAEGYRTIATASGYLLLQRP